VSEVKNKSSKNVQKVELSELPNETGTENALGKNSIDAVKGVKVELNVILGQASLNICELFDLKEKSILTLNAGTTEPVDLVLDGQIVARGTLVVVDDNFGVQITEVVKG